MLQFIAGLIVGGIVGFFTFALIFGGDDDES